MNICKSCGVTIHEEGKSFCPACEVSAQEAKEVGLTGDGPTAEKAELNLEEDTQKVTVLKLSGSSGKTGAEKSGPDKTETGLGKKPTPPPASQPPSGSDDRLSFSESPLNEVFAAAETAKEEPETLSAAIEKSGPKSYLSAEERKLILSELEAARKSESEAAIREIAPSTPAARLERRRNDLTAAKGQPRPVVPAGPDEAARADRLPPTSVARGIAYFSGTHIHLVGGAHLASGEELIFKDRVYVLKEKPGSAGGGRWAYVLPMVMLLLAGALLWVLSRPMPGGVAGLTLDSRTRSTLPGVRVRLLEKGESAIANEAGFFVLPKLPPGSYNLLAEGPGVEGKAKVEITKGGIAPIIITLQPTQDEILSQIPVLEPKPVAQQQPEISPVPERSLAELSLSIDPADAEAYLDGQPMGSGGIFKNLPAGRHTLSVRREGFQDWQNPLELKAGRTNRLRVALVPKAVPSVVSQPARKGFEDYLKEGESQLAKKEYAKAVALLAEAIKIRPGSYIAQVLLGEAYWGRGDQGSGNNHFVKAARLYAEQGSYPKAEELYRKVLQADPSLAQPLLELGNLYVSMGDQEAARKIFQNHTKQFGNSPDGFFTLGKLEYQERRFKEAAKAFEKALINSSKPGLIHGYLTLTYIQNNNKKKAQAAYDSFMRLATPSELSFLKGHRDWSRVVADLSVLE